MIVNIIVSKNRVSGELRTGIKLRLENPPPGVNYRAIDEPVGLSPSFNDFYITKDTTTKWFLKTLIEPIYSLKLKGLTHAFFLNLFIPHTPWIQEIDQPIFNLFEKYIGKSRRSVLYRLAIRTFRYLFNRDNVIIVTWTQWSREGLEEEGFRYVRVVPPPMKTSFRKIDNKITIGFIGVEYHRKGGDIAEDIMSKLPRHIRKVYIGKSPRKISGIEYYNPMRRNELLKLMAEFDILLFPTRGEAYGFTALEAMSMGIPVVASNVDSIPEVVSDGGILCEVNDIKCFLDSIKELVSSPEYVIELGARAKAIVAQRHSPSIVGKELLAIYNELSEDE
ncbi:MAG: glycosyltransferase family 4 protein [Vulcanisaeta sp.]|jgi:glycosyltransferase involved in cell wall biosynthesis|uniref:Glycosyl transferase group 1 n=1 Tax=Vulcanisaeta moutnovskia (strain 768-28) TaxID=985053 RepID=F0QYI1_VULM7|nr:glycosyltransferase family 4 protein [Vulcanisaeta moutnovskia]ADY01414.1 glycosyl transferase group 1 [Vulcanisaeta moutnovskia 768-28]